MNIEDVYIQYKIMPSLRMHMYRVAAVAKTIIDLHPEVIEGKVIVTACLLHDMGNIIKSDLNVFPEFLEPEGYEYWAKIKDKFLNHYGNNEHQASLEIVSELGLSKRVYQLVDGFEFLREEQTLAGKDMAQIICSYSDMRVLPVGIGSLEARLEDGRKRFRLKHQEDKEAHFERMAHALSQMEILLFKGKSLKPEDITDEKVAPMISELQHFTLK